ncbi:5'-3' exonuclease, exo domain of DNA polymerase I [Metamycoplasma cloacale]|uniref:5'-3' exonuclease n=1 Tax=Metamycoplasma cloacale TaxID=92401 RepID=A0A2Z4LL71_9BACT|nr:5'-3' exonuclease H3TH domain-containing protein [Metamycoplasma cloacale]AWX42481.1 flap endonuclease [Metamycoplasma cloacale]VEU79173.1 5'-3' exonuclease, exo domain of DNA polymerase I [Metamycoplasma cloacale]
MSKILLIDGTYLAYKSYFATLYGNASLQTENGFPTNAIVGFFNTMLALIKQHNVSHLFVAFDSRVKTFRHEMYEQYKGTRAKAPADFHIQLNKIQELLTACNIANENVERYEADDIIAKITKMFQNEHEILIYSADQDLNQLITNNVSIIKKVKNENIILNIDNFMDYYGITPEQVIDYKAIVGDSSDNFKGIEGLGPKSATSLLEKYQTLENIYAHLDDITGKTKEKLINSKENAMRDKYLATLRTDFLTKTIEIQQLSLLNFSLTPDAIEILDSLELNLIKNKLIKLEIN